MLSRFFKAHKIKVAIVGGVVFICAIAAGTVLGLGIVGNGQPHECTIDDIEHDPKFSPSILTDIWELRLEGNDSIDLIIYFDYKPTDEEFNQIEERGIDINKHDWIPTGVESPKGSHGASAKVKDICKLAELDFVILVDSGMGQPFDWD